jgi:3-hydroxybutyryl-CoA dehydratase
MAREIGPTGRYFEEVDVGDRFESPGRTVTEGDVVIFAGLSGDFNQLHTDAEFAKGSRFGERVAHGLLVLSIASGLVTRLGLIEGTVQAFMALDWKFRAPVLIGDTVRVVINVRRKREMPRLGGGFVFLDVVVLNQRDEAVQKGAWTILLDSAP